MKLIFQSDHIPRTTTRTEWRKIDRWRRVCQAQLRDIEAAQRACLTDLAADTDLISERVKRRFYSDIRSGLIDRLINPPLMVYP